jgi:hypothetical protein
MANAITVCILIVFDAAIWISNLKLILLTG